jgi:hypothetical protein
MISSFPFRNVHSTPLQHKGKSQFAPEPTLAIASGTLNSQDGTKNLFFYFGFFERPMLDGLFCFTLNP